MERLRGRTGWSVVVVLAVLGATLIAVAALSQQHAPQPSTAATGPPASAAVSSSGPAAAPSPALSPVAMTLPRSLPVTLDVPAIGVHSDLLTLGLNPDQTVAVPPLGPVSQAGWYDKSPAPGQRGPAIMLGHIDSARYGPGVFFELGALAPGDPIEVTRADHTVAVFRVDRVVSYAKVSFPSLEVYGNTPNAQLRLITCGGVFDRAAHSYENNIVAYASLVSSRPQ